MVRFRLQFLGNPTARGTVILNETEITAADATDAAKQAAEVPWPPRARTYRLVDLEGREVDWRSRFESSRFG